MLNGISAAIVIYVEIVSSYQMMVCLILAERVPYGTQEPMSNAFQVKVNSCGQLKQIQNLIAKKLCMQIFCENLAGQVIHEQIDWNISETCNMVESIPSFSDEKLSESLNNKEYTEINDDISWYSEHQPVEEGSDDPYDSCSDYELHELPEVSNDDTVCL